MDSFSIHQEAWHDVWVAATATVRGRKKQVDWNIQQRVHRLLEEHGPAADAPLSLRVYGTMLKGFCVINNERARTLYTDCERVILTFATQPFGESRQGLKLPAAKKQRVDALTLDLSMVRDSETFDWTQAPLEEGALLRLEARPAAEREEEPSLLAAQSILEQVPLLDQAFPALDAPMLPAVAVGAAESLLQGAGPADGGEEAHDTSLMPAEGLAPPVLPVGSPPLLALGPAPSLEQLAAPAHQLVLVPRRVRHGACKLMVPGRVLGFDQEVQLSDDLCDDWQAQAGGLTREPASHAELEAALPDGAADRLGLLRPLLEEPAAGPWQQEPLGALQPLAAAQVSAAETRVLCDQQPAEATESREEAGAGPPGAGAFAFADGALQPCAAGAPLQEARGAAGELVQLLSGQSSDTKTAGSAGSEDAVRFDHQTADVKRILHNYIGQTNGGAGANATLEDLIPTDSVPRDTAARMFLAVLTLATSGDLSVAQSSPYGPIEIALH